MEDKYIGLVLALASALLTGISFIVTKKGLMSSRGQGDSYDYLANTLWWTGMIIMITGELANFAAYSFAPAILVTPLGALSVLVSAILASIFLGETLGREGIIGCALSLIGSLIIILHAPEEQQVDSINEILNYVVQPGFLFYMMLVFVVSILLIYYYAPRYGKRSPLIYITICSLVGSLTVIACKAFGIALKLTFSGSNQFVHPSTYGFMLMIGITIMTQMNYFNKALDIFSTNVVTPVYYVFFTTATIVANIILFKGIYNTDGVQLTSILCGFLTIFIGVFLLNSHAHKPRSDSLISPTTLPTTLDQLGFATLEDDYGEVTPVD